MRNGSAQPIVRARGHQHQVIRSRRNRTGESKADQGNQYFIGHVAIIGGSGRNETCGKLREMHNVYLSWMKLIETYCAPFLDGRISNLQLADQRFVALGRLRRVSERTGVIKAIARLDPAKRP